MVWRFSGLPHSPREDVLHPSPNLKDKGFYWIYALNLRGNKKDRILTYVGGGGARQDSMLLSLERRNTCMPTIATPMPLPLLMPLPDIMAIVALTPSPPASAFCRHGATSSLTLNSVRSIMQYVTSLVSLFSLRALHSLFSSTWSFIVEVFPRKWFEFPPIRLPRLN
jgi:hypothetical protein